MPPRFPSNVLKSKFYEKSTIVYSSKLACLNLDMTCLTHENCYFLTGYKQCLESLGFRTNPLQQPRVSEAWDRPDVRCFFLSTLLSFYRKIILLISDLNLSLNCCFKLCCILMFLLSLLSFIFSFLGMYMNICPLCPHDISVSVASQVYGDFSNADNFLRVII